jgi:hypothetical protein
MTTKFLALLKPVTNVSTRDSSLLHCHVLKNLNRSLNESAISKLYKSHNSHFITLAVVLGLFPL